MNRFGLRFKSLALSTSSSLSSPLSGLTIRSTTNGLRWPVALLPQYLNQNSNNITNAFQLGVLKFQQQKRFNSSDSSQSPPKPAAGKAVLKLDKPSYHLSFTCKKCDTRSGHVVSKQAYHNGTVLIQCPGCNNRHLIADHLKVSQFKV